MTIDKCTVFRSPLRTLAVVAIEPKTLIKYGSCKLCGKKLTENNNSSLTLYSASDAFTHVSIVKSGSGTTFNISASPLVDVLANLRIKTPDVNEIILSQAQPIYFDVNCRDEILNELNKSITMKLDKSIIAFDNSMKFAKDNMGI